MRTGLNYGPWPGGVAVFLLSGQLSGSPCRTKVQVIRDFATTCTCTCQHYYAIFMHSAHVHMCMYTLTCTCMHMYAHVCTCMHMYALCGYTRQPAQWHLSSYDYSHHSVPKGFSTFINGRQLLGTLEANGSISLGNIWTVPFSWGEASENGYYPAI